MKNAQLMGDIWFTLITLAVIALIMVLLAL